MFFFIPRIRIGGGCGGPSRPRRKWKVRNWKVFWFAVAFFAMGGACLGAAALVGDHWRFYTEGGLLYRVNDTAGLVKGLVMGGAVALVISGFLVAACSEPKSPKTVGPKPRVEIRSCVAIIAGIFGLFVAGAMVIGNAIQQPRDQESCLIMAIVGVVLLLLGLARLIYTLHRRPKLKALRGGPLVPRTRHYG